MRIIGWAYEADMHCPDCAAARFGNYITNGLYGVWADVTPVDREGNEIRPFYSIDEGSDAGDYCGDCFAEINPPPRGAS